MMAYAFPHSACTFFFFVADEPQANEHPNLICAYSINSLCLLTKIKVG